MSVLSRAALEESPLADLHTIAGELGLDGYRRQRKADLIERIVVHTGGEPAAPADADADAGPDASTDDDGEARPRPRRGRRGGRRGAARDADDADDQPQAASDPGPEAADDDRPASRGPRDDDRPAARSPRSRSRRGPRDEDATPRDRDRDRDSDRGRGDRDRDEREIEGVVELLGNGSGFVRVNPPEASDDDVYISAAQVRRCELVSGDTVSGPARAPRRSERYPSLVRIDAINGRPADEVAEGTHFDDLPAAFPADRFSLGADDPTLKALEWLTPFGRGSRVTITGAARAGKSETLRRLAGALREQDGIDLTVVLVGVRPEELALWTEAGVEAQSALSLAASTEAQAQAVERAVDTARRLAARGGNAVVLIDTLEHLPATAARRALAAARNIVDGGSLTVVATSAAPIGGETTVIALDLALTATGHFPALDIVASGTLRPELLVGQPGAEAIAAARKEKLS